MPVITPEGRIFRWEMTRQRWLWRVLRAYIKTGRIWAERNCQPRVAGDGAALGDWRGFKRPMHWPPRRKPKSS